MKYLIALIAVALPAYLIRFSLFGVPTTLLEILIYLVFVIGLFKIEKAREVSSKFWWPVGLLLVAAAISVWVSPDKHIALGQFKALFLDPILVVWLTLSYLNKEDFSLVFGSLALSGLYVSGFSFYQKFIGDLTSDGRIVGIFGYSPNYTALFLGPIIAICFAYALELVTRRIEVKNRLMKIYFCFAVVILGFAAVYLSVSRGALLALLGAIIFYLILHFWPKIKDKIWVKIGLLVFIVILLISSWLVFRPNFMLSPEAGSRITSSNNVRFQIWQTSVELIEKHPILGIGLGNYQNAFDQLTHNRVNFSAFITPWALSAHNIFLMFWLSTGLLGIIAFVWLLVNFFKTGTKFNENALSRAIMTGMIALILQGMVDTQYFKNDLSLLFWLFIAFMLILSKDN